MNILFYGEGLASDDWLAAIRTTFPDGDVRHWTPDLPAQWQADYALLWHPPVELFAQQTQLRAIFNLGAGVDGLLRLPGRPAEVPIIKLRNAGMDQWMFDYVLYGVLHFSRNFDRYRQQQQQRLWHPQQSKTRESCCIGILGLGALGHSIATQLKLRGYRVQGWSRTPKALEGIDTYSGLEHLDSFLQRSQILVNLLPATSQTRNLLNAQRLAHLPAGAVLISAGRGTTLDQDAVYEALCSTQLRGALLDVFSVEPLPAEHPLWSSPTAIITPHIAAPTQIDEALGQIASDIAMLEQGLYVPRVDNALGY